MNDAIVPRVMDAQRLGRGRHLTVPASVLSPTLDGHLKYAIKVVVATNESSIRTSCLECKNDALFGNIHPILMSQAVRQYARQIHLESDQSR
jgi:hypothetical protein